MYVMDQSKEDFKGVAITDANQLKLDSSITYLEGNAKLIEDKPSVIVAHTIKGKGVSFMEDNNNWHYRVPSKVELEMALAELN